ncbi:succinyl-diaminopimelate desuccinylase [Pararhodobacter aggregans]|uniref:Succinyl-diaminopimelate desuccinylase n=1 Tax=Pararhodobacter aggregans TaxID=404875 RepID=A0A2T7URR0_9RHOB|nr:succinyl-diaminopimelate desuccinylase [Pararhodobacter aggregans]PTX00341.1 succinyldiaminopimelate desuccinylase [Pararhodobacter aggregans]PVE47326.1 succinyl-diaminopimelate desuccinylase [Pararhodobacter aggregans]
MPAPLDPVDLTARLIRCPSVTPEEGGALRLLEAELSAAGFVCTRVDRGETANLFARWGAKGANRAFGFNGHTDVVPPGNPADWRFDPFSATLAEGRLYGRGACDMKSGVAAFVAAAVDFVRETPPDGAVILAITGDEEGDATDGTVALLDWMAAQGERMSHCIVGEPTCPEVMGEMMKNGRRGSMTARIEARGSQGHAAYPHRAKNPLPALVRLLDRLASHELDRGNALFDPSTLALTTIDTGNPATNVIPAKARAVLNIRFNDLHSGASLTSWLEGEIARVTEETGVDFSLVVKVSGESFVTEPGWFTDLVADAVEAVCERRPALSTSGGTSDARFVKDHCPVVEFGLVGQSMHKTDEHVEVAHVQQLKAVYRRMLDAYFA